MDDKQQKIGKSENQKIRNSDDQQVSQPDESADVAGGANIAQPLDSAQGKDEAVSSDSANNTAQTDAAQDEAAQRDPATVDDNTTLIDESPEDEVSEQIPEPEIQAKTTEDTVDADVAEQAADSQPAGADNTGSLTVADASDTPVDGSTDQADTAEPPALADTTDQNPNAKWYVVHTFSGHENKVATNLKQRIESEHLENKIVDILVPTQDKIEIRGGKKEQVKEKIFPGYILVKMDLDDQSWLAVRTTQGVTAFVGMNNKPTPISDREVQSIVKFMTQGAPATFKDVFMVDDTVKIVDGPFTDFIGKVDSVDKEKGKVRVLVSIFGRETPVELDFLQVTKL